MTAALPWMPAAALRQSRAAQPFAAVVRSWAENWFAASGWVAADVFDSAVATDWSILRDDAAFQLLGKPKALLELAFAMLGQEPRQGLTDADLRFLRRLGSRALDDLQASVEALLPAGAAEMTVAGQPVWRLTIGSDRTAWLAIALNQATFAAIARKVYPLTKPKSRLSSARDAVNDVVVPLSGRIGSARLAVEQIGGLEVGDLLLLDEAASAPLRLTVAGQPSDLYFAIDASSDRLTLTMQER